MALNVDPNSELGRMVIKITGDASEFAEELQKTTQDAAAQAKVLSQNFDELFKGASQEVKLFGRILRADMEQNKRSLNDAFKSLKDGVSSIGATAQKDLPQMSEAFQRMGGDIDQVTDSAKKAGDGIKNFISQGLKIVGIVGAVQVLRQVFRSIVNLLRESVEEFKKYSFEVFRLDVAVRAAQRRMGEAVGTTEEWRDFIIQLREQFQIFSTRDLTAATSRIILLTRELKFNRAQVEQVIQSSIVLAETMGVKVEEAARRLTLFLDTGYSRGLAALGLQISRVTVEEEAHAQGIEKSWNEMTRAERAAVSLTVVIQQLEAQTEDAGRAVETFQGQVMALEATQSDAMLEIGENASFFVLIWERIKTTTIDIFAFMSKGIQSWARIWILMMAAVIAAGGGVIEIIRRIGRAITLDFGFFEEDNIFKRMEDFFNIAVAELTGTLLPALSDMGNVGEDALGSLAEGADEAGEAISDLAGAYEKGTQQIEDELQRLTDAQEDAQQRLEDGLADQAQRFLDQQEDLARRLADKLADIDIKFDDRQEKVIRDAKQKEADIITKMNEDIAQSEAEFKLKEIQAQREFNLEMEKLQREFLFSLEDAVRERDARQVLLLMRRFNLNKAAREEEFEEQKQQREEQQKLEIARIKQRAALRRAALRTELNQRLADLERQRKREKAKAEEDFDERMEELRIQNDRRNEALELAHDRRLRDLEIHHQRRLFEIGKSLAREFGLNLAHILRLSALWGSYFQNITAGMIDMRDQLGQTGPSSQPQSVIPGGITGDVGSVAGFARGGSVIARRPTLARFGEAGPEMASFTPLNRMNGAMPGGGGRVGIDITVRPDDRLIAEVVETTMGEVADVIIETERAT